MASLEKILENLLNESSYFTPVYNTPNVFPKYKITQMAEYSFMLELALAGYDKDKIEVSTVKNKLSISYKVEDTEEDKKETEYPKVLENYIAERSFEKIWTTNEQYNLNVKSVTMKDGILKVEIDIEIPETLKTKTYKVK